MAKATWLGVMESKRSFLGNERAAAVIGDQCLLTAAAGTSDTESGFPFLSFDHRARSCYESQQNCCKSGAACAVPDRVSRCGYDLR